MSKQIAKIAFIGGSGLYEIKGIENIIEKVVDTPFGKPSDKIVIGTIRGISCAFLPRHGKYHTLNPSEINQRANIYALKSLGVEQIVSFNSCGSLQEHIKPKDFVIPDQVFDKTKNRPSTFFEKGIVVHVSMAEPFCNQIRNLIHESVYELGLKHHVNGTYVCVEGPQFSTKIESQINRQLGFSIVGMTLFPEAKLAREAEMCYANISLVTDCDAWRDGQEVTNDLVTATASTTTSIKNIIKSLILKLAERKIQCSCSSALAKSIMTPSQKVLLSANYKNLSLFIDKYYKPSLCG
jgi:5'-methylthioadenosine phosphorylase